MLTTKTVVLGKGDLAIDIAEMFVMEGIEVVGVVPVSPPPDWTGDLEKWARAESVPVLELEEVPKGLYCLFSCFYDRLVPADLLEATKFPLNLHPGPLPKYRGVRPVNWALKNGEREHGVTIHRMDGGFDTGPIYGQVKFTIDPKMDEVMDVYSRCLMYGRALFLDTIDRAFGGYEPYEQDEAEATTYTSDMNGMLEERSDWTRP